MSLESEGFQKTGASQNKDRLRNTTPKHLKVAFTVGPCVGGVTFCNLLSFMFYRLKTYNSLLQATKYKSGIKRKFEDNFKEGGQRNWLQVGGENNGF